MYSKTFHIMILSLCFIYFSSFGLAHATSQIVLIKDIQKGGYSSSPISFTDVNGIAFFLADSGGAYNDNKYALWRSDGTEEGTWFIKDLDNPEYAGTYGEFTAFKGQLFFRGLSDSGYELWKSDGTEQGTIMITDIYPGLNASGRANSSYPSFLTAYDNDGDGEEDMLMFVAITKEYGKELWRSDGTPSGSYMVKDIHEGAADIDADSLSQHTHQYAISDNIYYFSAINNAYTDNAGNYIGGYELWRSNGTAEGTYMVKDLTPYNAIPYGPGSSNPANLIDLNGMLIFSATTDTSGNELFRSDGTSAGTVLLKDINVSGSSYPSNFVKAGNQIYFLADDGSHGRELWVTDGSAEGTRMVIELIEGKGGITNTYINGVSNRDRPIIDNMTEFKDLLFFMFNDGEYNHGFELWRSDGTVAGTYLFKDIGSGQDSFGYSASAYPSELTVVGEKMFFSAWDPVYFRELWVTDGTEEGTHIVEDMAYHEKEMYASSNPKELTNINGTLFFNSHASGFKNYPEMGYELWKVTDEDEISFTNPTGKFDLSTGKLFIYGLDLPIESGDVAYSIIMSLVPSTNSIMFELDSMSIVDDNSDFPHATLDMTGMITIPNLEIADVFYSVTLQFFSGEPLQFALKSIMPKE